MSNKWVYYFGDKSNAAKGKDGKNLLGGKGQNLSIMTNLGLPIPTGFVITTRACIYAANNKSWPQGLDQQVATSLKNAERISGKTFGDAKNPLLLSVRSGAAISMPGMMDTVLNLGLNDKIVKTFAKNKGERFAYDSMRRFITMFADVVMDVGRMKFEHLLDAAKEKAGVKNDNELSGPQLRALCEQYKVLYQQETGNSFPQDPHKQLELAITAVFNSWNNSRAIKYRALNRIPDDLGTAVNVQEMVFGNMGDDCATGVAFTRHPSTGQNARFGEYLANAQGEDVVAGIRTPKDIEEMKVEFPDCAKELYDIFTLLENHYRDMQDIEFTIERNKLFILQTRNGKRTGVAAVKMAVDMVREGFITKDVAIMRVTPNSLDSLLHPQISAATLKKSTPLAKGLPASPGAAVGQVVFSAATAVQFQQAKKKCLLVRLETSPEDISGMAVCEGILTARGGMTSHAAVVARGMNVCCIAGCSGITVDEAKKVLKINSTGQTFHEGDWLSLNGTTGEFYAGQLEVEEPKVGGEFAELLKYADELATLEVRTNADTPHDALVAKNFGAKGIGLVRTEHMFFNKERIFGLRRMICANNEQERKAALENLIPFQRSDFEGLLDCMDGLPVIIRLLDPPLHEFLPHETGEQQELADALAGGDLSVIKNKVESMSESNPMLGFRGCRLGVVYPEITEMQCRAIFQASLKLVGQGKNPRPCIEIPLVGHVKEYSMLKKVIQRVAHETGAEGKVHYEVGTMIETPRAALTTSEFAKQADFLSFGTNDLTQMTCGFSRDDAAVFLKPYVEKKIYSRDPFQSVDQEGVGKLMKLAVTLARSVNRSIDIGICGEHGGEPTSVEFCHIAGLDNVSCSPYRVPIARLAAGQAAVKYGKPKPTTVAQIFSKL